MFYPSKEELNKTTVPTSYRCWNCGRQFKKELEHFTFAVGSGGMCPYCTALDNTSDRYTTHIAYGGIR